VFDTESKAEHDKVAAAAQRIKEPAATLLTAVAAYNEALGELREIVRGIEVVGRQRGTSVPNVGKKA
jgi:hypothetical protein